MQDYLDHFKEDANDKLLAALKYYPKQMEETLNSILKAKIVIETEVNK